VKVIDASTLSKYILKEPGWRKLPQHLREGISVDHVVKETANSIWKAYQRGYITPTDAEMKYKALKKLAEKVIIIVNQQEVMDEAFNIAINNAITVYDALYIALAKTRGVPLVTSDNTQASIAEKLNIKVVKC